MENQNFELIAKLLRYYSLLSTTTAGSGHPTSSMSAADLMAILYFKYFQYDFDNPTNKHNDRLIFSKGHASPLLYSLYKLAGKVTTEDLLKVRTLGSPLQGHPTPETPYVDFATGSLGMGLSFGLGMALASQLDKLNNKIYVLLGDGEMAEGNIWESIEVAGYYKTNNLIGIIDVNGLGETGQTMLFHDIDAYQKRVDSFGWNTITIYGHKFDEIDNAFIKARESDKPFMIIANTLKGKGVAFLEGKEGRHGKALKQEEFDQAIQELNIVEEDKDKTFTVQKPEKTENIKENIHTSSIHDLAQTLANQNEQIPTRKAYGLALAELVKNPDLIVLDGDLSDSTFSGLSQKEKPEQFFNMFIAEQNMVGVAVGLSKMGKTVFSSTFAAFLTRAFDQIRIASMSEANIKLCGSHAGVSIGEDGASQMGLEDIAMMRAIYNSTILYPSDAISTVKMVQEMVTNKDITYLRTTRPPLDIIYKPEEQFPIGGSKLLKSSKNDVCAVIAAGITVHEALKAYEMLKKNGIPVRIIDCYSVKPIDSEALLEASDECNQTLVVVEDHYYEGGLGDAILNVFAQKPGTTLVKMAISDRPHSGKGSELLQKYGISAEQIVAKVRSLGKILN